MKGPWCNCSSTNKPGYNEKSLVYFQRISGLIYYTKPVFHAIHTLLLLLTDFRVYIKKPAPR